MNSVFAIGLVSSIAVVLCAGSAVCNFVLNEASRIKKSVSVRVRLWRRGKMMREIDALDRLIAKSTRIRCDAEATKASIMRTPEYKAIEKIRKENLIEYHG